PPRWRSGRHPPRARSQSVSSWRNLDVVQVRNSNAGGIRPRWEWSGCMTTAWSLGDVGPTDHRRRRESACGRSLQIVDHAARLGHRQVFNALDGEFRAEHAFEVSTEAPGDGLDRPDLVHCRWPGGPGAVACGPGGRRGMTVAVGVA